ncbi:MAG: hypothetical protein M1816_007055 [Peltula sp. TS41687]|nr:MAG: hypothetical protein M1816_007055 [Peltula sp. TS41687]
MTTEFSRSTSQGMSTMSINTGARSIPSPQPTSQYAPRLTSITDNTWVHQKILLINGQVGDGTQKDIDGTMTVSHHQDSFPQTMWPVSDSHFKALVHLTPGPNRLRFDLNPSSNNISSSGHTSWCMIHYLPPNSSPPLQLAILVAKDSPMTFDVAPERAQKEGNGLDTAIRKFKMAAYLWQAFTGEQMHRNQLGRRCYRFEEEWQVGTLSQRDREVNQMRNEPRIHIIRTDKTVQEIRNLDLAQQCKTAKHPSALFDISIDAVREYFKPAPGQEQYVSVLILDSHWDPEKGMIRGHAALGGGRDGIRIAIFGSHALHSYPNCIEEVVPAFSDCTRTDTRFLANDSNESGSSWEAATIGIGGHMHETGHLFGCPHRDSGIMLRDFTSFNRTFICREPYSTRLRSQGLRLCLQQDECSWHRLDCLRFRFHPSFRIPADLPLHSDASIQIWPVGNGNVVATALSGVAWIELFVKDDASPSTHLEFFEERAHRGSSQHVVLNETELRGALPENGRRQRLRLDIHSAGRGKQTIEDFSKLTDRSFSLKMGNGRLGYKGVKVGLSQTEGSKPQELVLESAIRSHKLLTRMKVYHGLAVDGIEFFYEDYTSQLFGTRGGTPGGSDFVFDIRRGETIYGFYLRAGHWIDGIQILTTSGRKSAIFGNPKGGSGHTLIPPRNYTIAGVWGSSGPWVDGFGLIIMQ